MKVNSYDKKFVFTDELGSTSTFFAVDIGEATRNYRDRLAHIEGIGINRAVAVVNRSSVEVVDC